MSGRIRAPFPLWVKDARTAERYSGRDWYRSKLVPVATRENLVAQLELVKELIPAINAGHPPQHASILRPMRVLIFISGGDQHADHVAFVL